MRKRVLLMALGMAFLAGGCAAGPQTSQAASTATSAGSQPTTPAATTQPGDSQDRDARIKESDAVRRSMGY